MAFSPFTKYVDIVWNSDNSMSDASLNALAAALDMEVKEFSTPKTANDGATTVSKYLVLPGTETGFYIVALSSSTSYIFCSWWYTQTISFKGTSYYLTKSSGSVSGSSRVYLKNISETTKMLWSGSVTMHILTTYTDNNGDAYPVAFTCSISANTVQYIKTSTTIYQYYLPSAGASSNNDALLGTDYIELTQLKWHVPGIVFDSVYLADTNALSTGDTFSVDGAIYTVAHVSGGAKAFAVRCT